MIEVYHYDYIDNDINKLRHIHVADICTNDLEEAFRLTNHIDSNWLCNPRVHTTVTHARSTSVGDRMFHGRREYHVRTSGFQYLNPRWYERIVMWLKPDAYI